jgi:peptidoglycan hydrolase-like protein with peptidoglycan-binding domain
VKETTAATSCSCSNSGFSGAATGFFGPLTLRALVRFQGEFGIASSSSAGSVGPLTRGFFQRQCGNGLGNGNSQGNGKNQDGNPMASSTQQGMPPLNSNGNHGQDGNPGNGNGKGNGNRQGN